MNITSPLAFKLIFKYRIGNRFNLLQLAVCLYRYSCFGGHRSEHFVCSFCSPNKPQLEILTGQERRKRDYAEGANPYFLVKRTAKRLAGFRLSSCFPVLCCNTTASMSELPWPSEWRLNSPMELQLLCFQSLIQVLHQLRRERPITAMHLHHKVPSVHGV